MFIYLSFKSWGTDPLDGEVSCNLAPPPTIKKNLQIYKMS